MKPYPGTVLTLGSTGPAVAAVQKRLGVGETSTFGPDTAAHVKAWQSAHDIAAVGAVGPETWSALFDLRTAIIEVARKEIGVHEEPPGSNTGPRVDVYEEYVGMNPDEHPSWCASFACWVIGQAAELVGEPMPVPKTPMTHVLYNWGVAHGKITHDPQPGDIGCVIGGSTGHRHTVLIASAAHPNGRCDTLEGNSNTQGSSDGEAVVALSAATPDHPGRATDTMDCVSLAGA